MRFISTVLFLILSQSAFAQTQLLYSLDQDSPDQCVYSVERTALVIFNGSNIYFGWPGSNGEYALYADYSFSNINQGKFESGYETPLGNIKSFIVNTFDGTTLKHERTFPWYSNPFRKDTFSAQFTGNKLVIQDDLFRDKPMTCVFTLIP